MVLFYFYSSGISRQDTELHRGIYVLITYLLIFILYPFHTSDSNPINDLINKIPEKIRAVFFNKYRPGLFDLILALLAVASVGYYIVEYDALGYRAGAYTETDKIFSTIGIIIGLEVSRRLLGWSMTLVGLLFLVYTFWGNMLPGVWANKGFPLEETMTFYFFREQGVFGIMANVLVNYVILFVFFGAFLRKSGAFRFFMDFPVAVAGNTVGGPAKVAVVASAFFGSISGSAIANTVSTGTFTIPLMKRAGFKPHVAGAVEPSASITGMFMPPIMGAGGFLMAELTDMPYVDIMLISLFPALVYFLSILVGVHLEAKKHNLRGIEGIEVQSPWAVLKKEWYLSLPLVVIILLMIDGYSASLSAFWGTVTALVVSWFDKEYRMGIREIYEAMMEGAKATLIIGATVGVIGIIVGTIELTGIGFKFSNVIISLAGGNLVIALLLIGVASLFLGMGVPVTASYLIMAVLTVTALEEMGVVLIAAHQIVYWFSQDSNITPPVCIAAFAGAAIAGGDPWKTGWTSFKFSKMLYVMPFLFAYTPAILLQHPYTVELAAANVSPMIPVLFPEASLGHILLSFSTAVLGTIFFGTVTMLYLVRETRWYEWIVLVAATGLTYVPVLPYYPIGITLFIIVYLWQKYTVKQQTKGAPA
jgi:TRAP transporter 4TM/12TM fusion protein